MRGKNSRQFGRFKCLTAIFGFMRPLQSNAQTFETRTWEGAKGGGGPRATSRSGHFKRAISYAATCVLALGVHGLPLS